MADYFPLIARAVAGLDKNTGENRRALYERAKVALTAQLRGVVPPLDESEITAERLALEEAIRRVERATSLPVRIPLNQPQPATNSWPPLNEQYGQPEPQVPPEGLLDGEPKPLDRAVGQTKTQTLPKLPPVTVIPDQKQNNAFTFAATRTGPLDHLEAAMKQGETKDLTPLMVEGVTAAATADGRIALVLHLKDQTICLEMNQQRVDEMRKQLAAIETFLRRKTGRA